MLRYIKHFFLQFKELSSLKSIWASNTYESKIQFKLSLTCSGKLILEKNEIYYGEDKITPVTLYDSKNVAECGHSLILDDYGHLTLSLNGVSCWMNGKAEGCTVTLCKQGRGSGCHLSYYQNYYCTKCGKKNEEEAIC